MEEVGLVDVCATASEAAIVVAIGGLLLRRVIRQSTVLEVPLLAGAVMLFDHLPHLVLHFFLL